MVVGRLSEHLSKAVYSVGSSRSEGGWVVRWLVAEWVAAILAVLVPVAYASPPDPSWIPGIYDYHDYDDVVGMVTDGSGVNDSQVTQRVECVFVGFVLRTVTGRISGPISHRQTIRGPPIETPEASAAPLLTPVPKALPPSSVLLIVPASSREVGPSFSSPLMLESPREMARPPPRIATHAPLAGEPHGAVPTTGARCYV